MNVATAMLVLVVRIEVEVVDEEKAVENPSPSPPLLFPPPPACQPSGWRIWGRVAGQEKTSFEWKAVVVPVTEVRVVHTM